MTNGSSTRKASTEPNPVLMDREDRTVYLRHEALDTNKEQGDYTFIPIRKLSDELLQRIFLIGRNNEYSDGYVSASSKTGFVKSVIKVCSHWRSVALSYPRLWSRIHIDCNGKKSQGYESHVKWLLEKSGDLPLELSLSSIDTKPILGGSFMQIIVSSANRWKVVRILDLGKVLQAVLSLIPKDVMAFPRLGTLNIINLAESMTLPEVPLLTNLTLEDSGEHVTMSTLTMVSAPLLVNFEIYGLCNPSAIFMHFPWNQITHFSCIDCTFEDDELPSILTSMSNLLSLSFYGSTSTRQNIALPRLQSLHFKNFGGDEIEGMPSELLFVLTAPNLRSLQCPDLAIGPRVILQFLKRSECQLEEITLFDTCLGEVWRQSHFEKVKRIALNHMEDLGKDLRSLTRSGGSSNILPHLESITINGIQTSAKTTVQKIITMLKSRLRPTGGDFTLGNNNTSCLCSLVTLNFEQPLDMARMLELKKFIDSEEVRCSGVKIDVTYGSPSPAL